MNKKELEEQLERIKQELKLLTKMAKRFKTEAYDAQINLYLDDLSELKKEIEKLK